jgi:iron complex outermembrane recepter protein
MRKFIPISVPLIIITNLIFGQENPDSIKTIKLNEVTVSANRLPILLKKNPGSISIVSGEILSNMSKGLAVDDALRLTPGVRIDNQHDGERVHVSIRGQGILTERGLRGIGVLIDGIPVNDPSGFAPDLYDVDWSSVEKIEVLRGPAASLYGGGGAAGVLNIFTSDGGSKPLGAELNLTFGSNGFSKALLQFDGANSGTDYRISYSRTNGDGYRDHQSFWSNKLYEKINFHPTKKLSVTQIISHTDYFQQNPEGLNLGQFDNLRQANPDACPFNEYQKTNRTTIGANLKYKISDIQEIEATSFFRFSNYKETSNKNAEYRNITYPGASIQYNLRIGNNIVKNNISFGSDMKWQSTNIYKLQSAANTQRIESIDETNLETGLLLANQIVFQSSFGAFALYKLNAGKLTVLGSLRYDIMTNELTNKMVALDTAKTSKNFNKGSFRLGANYSITNNIHLFAGWSQGFMPPSTEELASNPTGYSGFNTHLVPATSNCGEIGIRGFKNDMLSYEISLFRMTTENDFFRFKQTGRGNQEVFYGNAGNSSRNGIESFVSFKILTNISLMAAYTFADYKYTSAVIDPVYTDASYVLTTPPAAGQCLPNSPKHQLYSEIVYSLNRNIRISLGAEFQSKWAVYTDSKAYNGELDPALYQNWQKGFNLYNARISYNWAIKIFKGECSITARNFTGSKYMAFTEPDPDGNSYQPGPGNEFFGNIKIRF